MSVVIETTKGDITVDLYVKERPKSQLSISMILFYEMMNDKILLNSR